MVPTGLLPIGPDNPHMTGGELVGNVEYACGIKTPATRCSNKLKNDSPLNRYKFANEWDCIKYLHLKMLYWLYCQPNSGRARHFSNQLEQVLRQTRGQHQSILGAECWSLIYEARGELHLAIKHRKKEIRLIKRLFEIHGPMENYQPENLADRYDLLAILYETLNDLPKAITCLQESKEICAKAKIPFDGKRLLQDVMKDYAAANTRQVKRKEIRKK